jgi:hypothetical protein
VGKENDEAQRKTRARALRVRIGRLKSRSKTSGAGPPSGAPLGPESPHQFVERRMREIAAKKRAAASKRRGAGAGRRAARTKSARGAGKKR